jgi:hypothetical protein
VTGRDAVTARVVDFVAAADDEVVYMTVEDLLTEETGEALSAASDRGVSIRLGGMSDASERRLATNVPDSLWDWSDTPAGRLLMVDEERTLVSVLVDGDEARSSDTRDETAIWGAGPANSLVVVLKALFTWQLDGDRE